MHIRHLFRKALIYIGHRIDLPIGSFLFFFYSSALTVSRLPRNLSESNRIHRVFVVVLR